MDKAVLKKMEPYFSVKYGNPSSVHQMGVEAEQAIAKARRQVADFLGCSGKEIIFTSGATESNNWVLRNALRLASLAQGIKVHIVVSSIEHSSILDTAKVLEKEGAEITYLPVDKEGLVNPLAVKKAIKKNTVLVSIIYANNEIGVIQPIKEIGKVIKKENKNILFHTDAVQAINYLDCDVKKLGVDLLTFNGHKIYGPKGVGVLYIRNRVKLEPLITGGGHEFGLRSGTENVPVIVGLGEAVRRVHSNDKVLDSRFRGNDTKRSDDRIKELRDRLIKGILENIPKTKLNGSLEKRLPNNVNISFKGAEGESIVMALSQKGVYVSTASACASHSLKPSHVLSALKIPIEEIHCSVRFSLGKQTTKQEVDFVLKILPGIVERLRKISGR